MTISVIMWRWWRLDDGNDDGNCIDSDGDSDVHLISMSPPLQITLLSVVPRSPLSPPDRTNIEGSTEGRFVAGGVLLPEFPPPVFSP